MTTELLIHSAERDSSDERVILRSSTVNATVRRVRLSGSMLILGLFAALAPSSYASDLSQQAVNKAGAFLGTAERGKEVLSYVHFGADYKGHKYVDTISLDQFTGAFALVYRFWWEDDGVTDVAFLCDARGFIDKVRIVKSNAFLSQPFLLANASIKVLGHSLIELYKDKLSDDDQRQLHDLVSRADAKGLLEFSLKWEQLLN